MNQWIYLSKIAAKVQKKSGLYKFFAKNNRLSLRNKTFFLPFCSEFYNFRNKIATSFGMVWRQTTEQNWAKWPKKYRKNAESNTTNFLNKTSQKHSTDFYNCRNKIAPIIGIEQSLVIKHLKSSQQITTKIRNKIAQKCSILLHNSKKSSTFAADFEN